MMDARTPSPQVRGSEFERLHYIDALRGIAILGVLAYHVAIANSLTGPVGSLLFAGARGVQLFFVVSAFTLFLSLDRRQAADARPVAAYFVRRFFRIVPLHHLALVAVLFYRGLGPRLAAPDGLVWWDVVLAFLFLNGWHPYRFSAFVPGGWSIVTEVCFYTVLPVIYRCVRSLGTAVAVLLLTLPVAYLARWAVLVAFPHLDQEYVEALSWMNFAAQSPVFALGIVCYRLLQQGRIAACRRRGVWLGMVWAATLTAAVLPFAHLREFEACLVYGVVWAVLVLGLHHTPSPLLVNRFTRFWGVRSYSAYIAHPGVIHLLQPLRTLLVDAWPVWAAVPLWSLAVLAGVAATAHLLHIWIEEPARSVGSRMIRGWVARRASVSAAEP